MVSVGITGRIGSGKTLVCKLFSDSGVPVFYSDAVARELSDTHTEIKEKIFQEFGREAYQKNTKKLDRQLLADIVFNDQTKLEILNSIIHPYVFKEYELWKEKIFLPKSKIKYCLAESAILFESGFSEIMDYTLSVISDDKICLTRVQERDKTEITQVKKRMKFQLPNEILQEESDFTILNNGTIEDLQQKVKFFHSLFSMLQSKKETEE